MRSKGAALLSLTGDLEFIKDLRIQACKLGMHLNEYGLWRWVSHDTEDTSDSSQEENGHWELIHTETEEDILHELDKSWIEPTKRNFSFLSDKARKKPESRSRLIGSLDEKTSL